MDWIKISDIKTEDKISIEENIYDRYGDEVEVEVREDGIYIKSTFDKPTKKDWDELRNKLDTIIEKILNETGKEMYVQEMDYITPTHICYCDDIVFLTWDTECLGDNVNYVIADFFNNDIEIWDYMMYKTIINDIENEFNQGFFD